MARLTCEEARELAPELALGTIAGDDTVMIITGGARQSRFSCEIHAHIPAQAPGAP